MAAKHDKHQRRQFFELHNFIDNGDLDILGTTADLPALITKYGIDHVFIALPMSRYHDARRVFDTLSKSLVEVRLVADVPQLYAAYQEYWHTLVQELDLVRQRCPALWDELRYGAIRGLIQPL